MALTLKYDRHQYTSQYSSSIRCCLLVLLWLTVLTLSVESVVSSPIVFGTRNGYDVDGGTDPICWESSVSPKPDFRQNGTFMLENSTTGETIDNIQTNLFGDVSSQAVLLEECFNGTRMNIEPIKWTENNTLFVGTSATVRLNLQVDPTIVEPLDNGTEIQPITNATEVWVRMFLCDATKIGFCNPFLNTVRIDMTAGKNATDASMPERKRDANIPSPHEPYAYEEGSVLIGLEAQAHVFTRWVALTLSELPGTTLFNGSVDISFRTSNNSTQRGPFFFIGHAVIFLPAENGARGTRLDVAAAIPNKIVTIQPPPHILQVTKRFQIGQGVAIGVFASIELAMFCAIIYHRNNPVMTLSQGLFLAWLVGAAFVSTVSCFLLLPTHDIFCRLRGPLVLIPISMVAAVLVGRIWRVYSTLAVALSFASGTKKGTKPSFPIAVLNLLAEGTTTGNKESPRGGGKRQSLRQKITTRTTAKLIFLLTLPQIVLQVLDAILYNKTLVEQLDEAELLGRVTCAGGREWTVLLGVALIALVYIWAVYIAWVARDLPMLFNEKDCVFHAASINSVVVLIVIALVFITDKSTTSPDITVFLWSTFVIVVSASASWFIVAPKLQRIWSQEKVVLSTLLSNPNRASVVDTQWNGSSESSDQLEKSQYGTPRDQQGDNIPREMRPIVLHKDEALPRALETKVFALDKLIRHVTQECLEGRPISLSDWKDLMSLIESLNGEMERIEFDWTEGENDEDPVGGEVVESLNDEIVS